MRKAVTTLILTVAFSAAADEKLAVLKAGNETYTNVNVTSISATDIYFTHDGGMANVKIQRLSPELQKHFHFDPEKANAVKQKQALDQVKFHEQLLGQSAVRPPDMTRQPVAKSAGKAVWRTDYPGALKQAKSEGKLVLLDFTGSDWCGWCMKFETDVLSTPQFAGYADKKLELVRLDFPHHTPQPDDVKKINRALAEQFHVDGYPTFVLVNADGKELGRQGGYLNGGPNAFIAELEQFSR